MKPTTPPNQLSAFAVTAPGLEPLCASELADLGIAAVGEEGGVSWSGDLTSVARANLWLRTASRVIVRVAEFRARTFFELERHARQVPWSRFVSKGGEVEFRVTSRKSKLYHTGAIAQRLGTAAAERAGARMRTTAGEDDEDAPPASVAQMFVVRVLHDRVTISADSSGALLHFRGYRQALAKAPLRETLAAAILRGAGWRGDVPVLDPMCGSGTIPIEAALIARRIAPGLGRPFAFLTWPEYERAAWTRMVTEAREQQLERVAVRIVGADRDEGAIQASISNAERAGVSGDIDFVVRPLSAMDAEAAPGLVATNPPYGVRIGQTDALRNLYAQLGNVLRRKRQGWMLALLSADPPLERQIGIELEERFRTRNGGIPVRLVVGTV